MPDQTDQTPVAEPAAMFDPRPVLADGPRVSGLRCVPCRYPMAASVPACPVCGGEVAYDAFGPGGVTSASTCLHVRVPGRTPPYAVAYLDLDDGPRVLVHTAGTTPTAVGTRLRLTGKNEHGDLTAEATS